MRCGRDAWCGVGNETFCLLKGQKIEEDVGGRNDELSDSDRVGGMGRAP